MAHLRTCAATGKRIHPSVTAARKASRGPSRLVRVEKCAHCVAIPLKSPKDAGPGYHITRVS